MINNKKIIEKYHKKMETINKIEDEFTKSQNPNKKQKNTLMKKIIKNVKKKLEIKKAVINSFIELIIVFFIC